MIAARQLTLMGIRALFITGMDFYREDKDRFKKTIDGRTIEQRGPHRIDVQLEWLSRLVRTDARVSVDQTLERVLNAN